MAEFSWHTIPAKLTGLYTVYQYAVDRFIPLDVERHGFGSYMHVKAGTFVMRRDGGWHRYKPNRKGGHTHNVFFNALNRLIFHGKKQSSVPPQKLFKKECVAIFYENMKIKENRRLIMETLNKHTRKMSGKQPLEAE